MNDIPIDFWLAFAVVVVQLVFCHVLTERLKRENPKLYISMGSPHILLNNTPSTVLAFWKWLCSSGPKKESQVIQRIALAVRLLTVAFLAWFVFQSGRVFSIW